jgi:hypothetical protein
VKEVGGFSIVSPPSQLAADGTFDLGVKATRHGAAQWVCGKAAPGDKVGAPPARALACGAAGAGA